MYEVLDRVLLFGLSKGYFISKLGICWLVGWGDGEGLKEFFRGLCVYFFLVFYKYSCYFGFEGLILKRIGVLFDYKKIVKGVLEVNIVICWVLIVGVFFVENKVLRDVDLELNIGTRYY